MWLARPLGFIRCTSQPLLQDSKLGRSPTFEGGDPATAAIPQRRQSLTSLGENQREDLPRGAQSCWLIRLSSFVKGLTPEAWRGEGRIVQPGHSQVVQGKNQKHQFMGRVSCQKQQCRSSHSESKPRMQQGMRRKEEQIIKGTELRTKLRS